VTAVAPSLMRRKLGGILLALATGVGAFSFAAPGAGAATDSFNVNGTVAFNSSANRTTTHFMLSGNKQPSDVRVLPCSSADVADASGPSGTKSSPTGFGGSGQTGVKFQPGAFGNYTVVFSGHIFRVDVVIVSGHQHTVFGLGNATCAPAAIPPVTTTMPTTTTTTKAATPSAVTPPASGGVISSPNVAPATGTPGSAPVKVLGTNVARAGTGAVEPAVAGTALARTGRHTRLLLLLAGFALALGGFGLMVGEPRRLAPVRAS